MLTTANTGQSQERNIAGGIAPQTGLVIVSASTFYEDGLTLRWDTGGEVVSEYYVKLGTVPGANDIYESDVFVVQANSIFNDYRGSWTGGGYGVTQAWVQLNHRYKDGPFKHVNQLVTFDYTVPVSTKWDDSLRWDDSKRWVE